MLHQTLKDRHALPSTPCGVIPAHIGHAHVEVGGEEGARPRVGTPGAGGLVRPGGETGAGLCACWHSRVVPRALLETARAAERRHSSGDTRKLSRASSAQNVGE